jgi:hypothetical protein
MQRRPEVDKVYNRKSFEPKYTELYSPLSFVQLSVLRVLVVQLSNIVLSVQVCDATMYHLYSIAGS